MSRRTSPKDAATASAERRRSSSTACAMTRCGAPPRRGAHAFASLPASGGLALLIAAALALICANTPLAGAYHAFITSRFGVGPPDTPLSLTVGDWFSEGLLGLFFLLVGLEIR